jgi:hypothetical protein
MAEIPHPNNEKLALAGELYVKTEPRYGTWDLARQAVADADETAGRLSRAQAVAALLRDWNSQYYRMRPEKVGELQHALDGLLGQFGEVLDGLADRSIAHLGDDEQDGLREIFEAFRGQLGPVGASKTLSLFAPGFFPMWDTKIRKRYEVHTLAPGAHFDTYWRFMQIARGQIRALDQDTLPPTPLKRLDEYNYYRFTRGLPGLGPGD